MEKKVKRLPGVRIGPLELSRILHTEDTGYGVKNVKLEYEIQIASPTPAEFDPLNGNPVVQLTHEEFIALNAVMREMLLGEYRRPPVKTP